MTLGAGAAVAAMHALLLQPYRPYDDVQTPKKCCALEQLTAAGDHRKGHKGPETPGVEHADLNGTAERVGALRFTPRGTDGVPEYNKANNASKP